MAKIQYGEISKTCFNVLYFGSSWHWSLAHGTQVLFISMASHVTHGSLERLSTLSTSLFVHPDSI